MRQVLNAVATAFVFASLCVGADFQAGKLAHDRGDYTTALQEWLPLAEHGGPEIQYVVGVTYVHEGPAQNYAQAAKWYERAAKQGYPDAQFQLGRLYVNGAPGVQRNYTVAAQWYLMAAEQNHVGSQSALCGMYALGRGVRQDYSEAASWCKNAANQGDPEAQTALASLYATGDGVPQDYVLALMWVTIAEPQEGHQATALRKEIEGAATRDQVSLAQKLARAWQPPAANRQLSTNSGTASSDTSITEANRPVSARFEKLRKYMDAEMLDEATTEIQRLAVGNEFDPELHFALGEVYFRKGNLEEAIRQFTTSKKLDVHMWQATERLADSNLKVWETDKDQTSRIAACSLYEELERFDQSHTTISAFSHSNDLAKAKVRASDTARQLRSPEGLWTAENGDQYNLNRKDSTWYLSGPRMLLATLEESAGGLWTGHGSYSIGSCLMDLNFVVRPSDCAASISVEGTLSRIVGAADRNEMSACTQLLGGMTGRKLIQFSARRLR
jgi:hypothetical protein